MAAPVAGEAILPPQQNIDLNLINNDNRRPFESAEDDFTIAQLAKSKASLPRPSPAAPLTSSLGKRRKSKPVRYGFSDTAVEKKRSLLKPSIVVHDHSSKSWSSQKEKSATKSLKSSVENSPVIIRARELQSSLGTEHPSCIKMMMKAHVSSGYWMGFSQMFSKPYLPKTDTKMVIENEKGEIHHITYIADKSGLSSGWKKFVDGHNLLEGDVLVFHLVQTCKFKVYIIKAADLNEGHTEQMIPETDTASPKPKKTKRPKSLPVTMAQKKPKLSIPPPRIISRPVEPSGNDSEEVGSEVLESSRPSKPNLPFQEIKSFEDFHIVFKGTCIDSELPDDVRMSYYKLCISRKEFLHDALPEGLYCKLVAGMIGETVNIANEIKNCKITTTKEEFEAWDNSLKSFALLGMKVGFLRDRIDTLARLVFESEGKFDIQRYSEAKNEQKRTKDEIKRMKEKLVELNGIVDGLKNMAERHELKFQEEVDAPW